MGRVTTEENYTSRRLSGSRILMRPIRLPCIIKFGELANSKRLRGGPKRRYRDQLKTSLTQIIIDTETWKTVFLLNALSQTYFLKYDEITKHLLITSWSDFSSLPLYDHHFAFSLCYRSGFSFLCVYVYTLNFAPRIYNVNSSLS